MLKHGILGLLSYYDRTGYEIMEVFNDSLRFMWNANTSQIYRELQSLKEKGFAAVTEVPQTGRPDKKVYSITESGREELIRWLTDFDAIRFPNFPVLMKVFFGGMLPQEQALEALKKVRAACEKRLIEMDEMQPRLNTYKQDTANDDYALFWDMSFDFGRGYCEYMVRWSDECICKISQRMQEKESE